MHRFRTATGRRSNSYESRSPGAAHPFRTCGGGGQSQWCRPEGRQVGSAASGIGRKWDRPQVGSAASGIGRKWDRPQAGSAVLQTGGAGSGRRERRSSKEGVSERLEHVCEHYVWIDACAHCIACAHRIACAHCMCALHRMCALHCMCALHIDASRT